VHIRVTSVGVAPLGQIAVPAVTIDRLHYHECGSGKAIAQLLVDYQPAGNTTVDCAAQVVPAGMLYHGTAGICKTWPGQTKFQGEKYG
jgi:hypothetical protein